MMNKASVNVTAHPRESSDSAYQMKQETMNKATQNNQEPIVISSNITVFVWSLWRDSNPRPAAYKAAALPLSYTGG